MGEHIPVSNADDCQACGAETVSTDNPNLRRCPQCGAGLGVVCITGTPLPAAEPRRFWLWRFLERAIMPG